MLTGELRNKIEAIWNDFWSCHTWVEIDPDRSTVRIISTRRPTRNEARQYREDRMP
jgi:uncharacterized DUF497 family protein